MTPTPLPPSPYGEREGARAKRGGRVRGTVFSLPPATPLTKPSPMWYTIGHRGSEQGRGCRRCYYVV